MAQVTGRLHGMTFRLVLALALLFALPAVAQEATQPAEGPALDEPAQLDADAPAATPAEPTVGLDWDDDTPLFTILSALGLAAPDHAVEATETAVQQGEDLVLRGRTTGPDGKRTAWQSKGFRCDDCHNLVREDADLAVADPEARMDYAVANDLPFLMGTTLYGIVDRRSWFNDDYVKKYDDFVKPANESLREAIQLCSIECSQGRALEDWEIDAILAWMWTRALTWGDLVDAPALRDVQLAASGDAQAKADMLAQVEARFLHKSPATFVEPPAEHGKDDPGYEEVGDPARGEELYVRSCLHCHARGGPTNYLLADKKGRYRELLRNMPQKTKWSFYEAIRKGTKPAFHPPVYMPHFTAERMSDQQVEDLRAWIEQEATRKR